MIGAGWGEPAAAVDLRPGGVDCWASPVATDDVSTSRFLRTLSHEERARVEHLAFERERRSFIASRGLLRILLARYAGGAPQAQALVLDDLGKPRLAGECGQGRVRFNLSHSGGLWVAAVALHREIGVDVEAVDRKRNLARLARMYFSAAEYDALAALPRAGRTAGFYRCWTRKEAYLKARGFGITVPLDSFDVSLGPADPPRLVATRNDPADAARWSLADLDDLPGFAGAVATEGPVGPVRRFRLRAD